MSLAGTVISCLAVGLGTTHYTLAFLVIPEQTLLFLAKQTEGKDFMLFRLRKSSDKGPVQVSCIVIQRNGKFWQSYSIFVKNAQSSSRLMC